MPSDSEWFDRPDHELTDDEYPDDDFNDDDLDDVTETVSCPNCGAEVYEDAVACPVCGEYITPDNRVWAGRPIWWIVLGLLGIVAMIVTLATLPIW